jgi:hypothetical protein
MHGGDVDVAVRLAQLDAQGVREPADRVLGGAIGRLQRDAAIGERRAHLDDHAAVARPHVLQGRERAVDRAEIGDVGHPGDLFGRQVLDRREDRDHRVVHPDVDRPEAVLEGVRRAGHGLGIGDVQGCRFGLGAQCRHLRPGVLERRLVAGDEAELRTPSREGQRGRPSDAGRRTRYDHDHAGHFPTLCPGPPRLVARGRHIECPG